MGLFGRLKDTVAQAKDAAASVQQMHGDAVSARAEWGDGGTARPGWGSAGGAGTQVGGDGGAIGWGSVSHDPSTVAGEDAASEEELARLHARTEELRAILAGGAPGRATVEAARDTGERLARHAVVEFDLVLRPDVGGGERLVTVRLPVCGTGLRGHEEKAVRPVRFDPSDPTRLAFVWQGKRRSRLHRGHVTVKGRHGQSIDLVGLLPGRGLIAAFRVLAPGEVSNSVQTDLHVRLRTPGAGLGPEVACNHFLDWKPVKLLEPGLDVPVAVDPVSGELEDVVVAALTEELSPRFSELSAVDQALKEPIREIVYEAKEIAGTAKDLTSKEFWRTEQTPQDGGFAPGDPILAPANGVTFEQWVAVSAGVMTDRVPRTEVDAYAQRHGVPAGAWAEGERQWRRRQIGHPMMAEKYGRALERARKGG